MTILDDGRSTLSSAVSAGRTTVDDLVSGIRARVDGMRDQRRRRALIVDLGELCYAQQTGGEDPQLEADLDAVVAELQQLEAIAEARGTIPEPPEPEPDPAVAPDDASTNGHARSEPSELSRV